MTEGSTAGVVGILLAAGRGERFGGGKLLARAGPALNARTEAPPENRAESAADDCVGVMACRNLIAVLPRVVAVVRPDDAVLAAALGATGARIVRCANADSGMGASLACGVLASADAAGWVVALGDMPWIQSSTIARVAGAVADGALVAAPFHRGERGHPVGFGAACRAALSTLTGDDGAKSIVAAHRGSLARIDVDDTGALRDVDRPSDLA